MQLNALPGSPIEVIPALAPTLDRAERELRAREFRRLMKGGVRRILIDEDGDGEDGFSRVQCLYHAKRSGGRILLIDRGRRVTIVSNPDQLYRRLSGLFPAVASALRMGDRAQRPAAGLLAEE